MLPKILHYCWFGNNPKSKILQDCIKSWEHYCPDFEIKEWNENNTRQFANSFYKNALRKKKYAFVADYVRAKVLFAEGGIYLDTDMMLLQPLNELLKYDFFIGEEVRSRINFALFGATKSHRFLKEMLDFYSTTEFDFFAPPVITHTFSPLINAQTIGTNEIIFEPPYFYPLPFENRLLHYAEFIKPESYAVHLWDHSWAKVQQIGLFPLVKNLNEVVLDYLFYEYSYAYFRRYSKEFSRKIYQLLRAKTRLQ
jgi:mannosyltransferase OCH1-like enzyme